MTQGIEVVCELNTKVTAKQATILVKAIRAAMRKAYPDDKVRACWVHQSL
jgi:hypothetical protein